MTERERVTGTVEREIVKMFMCAGRGREEEMYTHVTKRYFFVC